MQIARIDETTRTIWFGANGREPGQDPYFLHYYRTGLDGGPVVSLTPDDGTHAVQLSPSGRHLIDTYSKPDVPPVVVLRDAESGAVELSLEKADISQLLATGWKPPTPIKMTAHDGKTDIYGLLFRPTNFDPSRKYPIVNNVYPGPQTGSTGSRAFTAGARRSPGPGGARLHRRHDRRDGHAWPVEIVPGRVLRRDGPRQHDSRSDRRHAGAGAPVSVDRHRRAPASGATRAAGSPRRPRCSAFPISSRSASPSRATTTSARTRTTGASATRVSSSKNADGTDSYDAEANQNFAKNLKGHLLLAHGTMDTNVPPYQTMLVADALIKANKDFDLLMIPNANHGYGAASNYMMRRRWDYFVKWLIGVDPPKEYRIAGDGVRTPVVAWQPQTSGVAGRLRGVSAVSPTVAWASGAAGTVLRTTDGGDHWQLRTVAGAETLDFRDVDAMSDQVAYALSIGAGASSRIYKTIDGGAHWDLQFANTDPKVFLDAMSFWDADRGIAFSDSVDGRFVILTTGNGGRSWERVPADRLPPALPGEGAFAASGTNVALFGNDQAWIGTTASRVLRSSDGGRSWTAAATPLATGQATGIFSIAFRDATARGRRRRRLPEGVRGDRQRGRHDGRRRHVVARARPRPVRVSAPSSPGCLARRARSSPWVRAARTGRRTKGGPGRESRPKASTRSAWLQADSVAWAAGQGGRISKLTLR